MEVTRDEFRLLNNALNEVLNGPDAIEEWESHARMGGDRQEVAALLRAVNDHIATLAEAAPPE